MLGDTSTQTRILMGYVTYNYCYNNSNNNKHLYCSLLLPATTASATASTTSAAAVFFFKDLPWLYMPQQAPLKLLASLSWCFPRPILGCVRLGFPRQKAFLQDLWGFCSCFPSWWLFGFYIQEPFLWADKALLAVTLLASALLGRPLGYLIFSLRGVWGFRGLGTISHKHRTPVPENRSRSLKTKPKTLHPEALNPKP